ncbi:MAG: hypothetical protein P8X96_14875 [Desulfobacteraceae bacterium]
MGTQSKWRNHFQENKTLFIILAVGLFLVELEIFALASMSSGRHSYVQVLDQQSNVIYEVKSATLNSREKAAFEKTFGPLANYQVNVVTKQRPFPFRPWFAAAAGLPIGAVLLFGFFVKAYEALFFSKEAPLPKSESSRPPSQIRILPNPERFCGSIGPYHQPGGPDEYLCHWQLCAVVCHGLVGRSPPIVGVRPPWGGRHCPL